MNGLRCVHTGILLERARAGLSEAERRRIEAHLEECGGCDAQARMLGALGVLVDGMPVRSASQRVHERMLAAALQAATEPESTDARSRPSQSSLVGGCLVAAAAAAILFALLGSRGHDRGARKVGHHTRDARMIQVPASASPAASQLLWGELRVEGRALAVGEAVQPGARLQTSQGARLRIGRAEILLAPSAIVRWEPEADTVVLHTGAMTVDVAPGLVRTFRVVTTSFIVEGLGTRFTVDAKSVRVLEGTVRVLTPDGAVRLASVSAGPRWRYRPRENEIPPLLQQARDHLANQRVEAARAVITRVHAGTPTQRQRAEADTLLAECALVSGNEAEAARRYEQVAERYPLLTAGEMALFAAARLHVSAGKRDTAHALLQRYVERYPAGRFREQAQVTIRALQQP